MRLFFRRGIPFCPMQPEVFITATWSKFGQPYFRWQAACVSAGNTPATSTYYF